MAKRRGRPPSKYREIFWEALPQSTNRPIGEILASIDKLTKDAFAAVDQPQELQELSEAVAKMPAYMKGLGYYLADAEHEQAVAKDDLEYQTLKKEKVLMDEGKAAAFAERASGIDPEVTQLKDAFRKAQHNFRVLKLQYDASNRQFEGWRSRLSVLKSEVREGV